jgi:hypothetical protein
VMMCDVRVRREFRIIVTDVTEDLIQTVRFCAELARRLILQSGNASATVEWADSGLS